MKEGRFPILVNLLFGVAMVWGQFWPGQIALSLTAEPKREIKIAKSLVPVQNLRLGDFHQLEVTCLENDQIVTKCKPHWESSDERVVIISRTGELLLVGEGLAVVCASWSLHEKSIQHCIPIEIRASEPPPPPRRSIVGIKVAVNITKGPQPGPFFAPFLDLTNTSICAKIRKEVRNNDPFPFRSRTRILHRRFGRLQPHRRRRNGSPVLRRRHRVLDPEEGFGPQTRNLHAHTSPRPRQLPWPVRTLRTEQHAQPADGQRAGTGHHARRSGEADREVQAGARSDARRRQAGCVPGRRAAEQWQVAAPRSAEPSKTQGSGLTRQSPFSFLYLTFIFKYGIL